MSKEFRTFACTHSTADRHTRRENKKLTIFL